jgi:hypothetical protein
MHVIESPLWIRPRKKEERGCTLVLVRLWGRNFAEDVDY